MKGLQLTYLPRVSVILPTFNRQKYLAEAIRSVLGQSVPVHDFVVVDDGSTDGTAEVVAEFGDAVTYFRQDNAGKLAAIATGLDRTQGELVWIMDDDDIATPDAVEKLAQPFAQNPALVLSYGRMTRFSDANPGGMDQAVAYPVDARPFLVQMMEDCFVTGHPCVLVRRDALNTMRPFDRAVIASVDYYLHLGVARLGPAALVDSVVLRQRQHPGLRGPAHSRYSEAERNAKWMAHDTYLLRKMLRDLPPQAYLDAPPWFDRKLGLREQRKALIQKAVIAARKVLWPQAVTTFRTAMEMLPSVALSDEELRLLERMLGSRYGIDEVYAAPNILVALRMACALRRDQAAILTAVSRPLLHEVKIAWRQLDAQRALHAIQSWGRLMDRRATRVALRRVIERQVQRATLNNTAT